VKGQPQGNATHVIWLLGAAAFAAVFVAHVLYLRHLTSAPQKDWADNFNPSVSFWQSYIIGQDYFVSFSYALSASFAVWATARFVYFRRQAAAIGAFGGVSLLTLLAAAGCFLIGCCGSPMLPIYISFFGSKAAGIGKPLMALISLTSIVCGYLYVKRRPECRCTDPQTCPFPEKSSPSNARQKGATGQTSLDREKNCLSSSGTKCRGAVGLLAIGQSTLKPKK
jgi:hypothetical protein